MRSTGSAHYIFFDHDRSVIVGACMQADRRGLSAYRQPGCLYVEDVGEHDSTDRDHADVFLCGGQILYPADLGQERIDILESPGNESQESLGVGRFFRLYIAELDQVFKPFFDRFDVAEHHRGRGGDVLIVCFVHHIQPFLRVAFSVAHQSAYPVYEDLGAGTG